MQNKGLKSGMLVSVEGIDCCGKTTLAKHLERFFSEKKYTVILTREPGGSPLGNELREIVHKQKDPLCSKSEYLLYAADRAQHFNRIVIPALDAKMLVISDRCADSSVAYQGFGLGLDVSKIDQINKWAMGGAKPNLVVYVKVDIDTALYRLSLRQEIPTVIEKRKREFWQKVSDGFDKIFATRNDVVAVDGNLAPQEVFEAASKLISEKLKI
jgi:dTMP kinase